MARQLGSFGVEHDPRPMQDPDEFDWFGSTIRLISEVNEVELIDFMHTARQIDEQDMAALAVVRDMFVMVIEPDDFAEFWRLAKVKRQGVEDLVNLFGVLLESITDRPTQQPSDSSNGRLSIDASSPVDSPSQASTGRPDLQIIHDDYRATQDRARKAMLAG